MALQQLIYISRPFGYDEATLNAILFTARHHNQSSGLTGALICREDVFLQLLEGPADAINATYERIRRDRRHIDVYTLWSAVCETRLFPQWGMRHDPARSWLWTPDEIWDGAPQKAPVAELRQIFTRVAAEAYDGAEAVL